MRGSCKKWCKNESKLHSSAHNSWTACCCRLCERQWCTAGERCVRLGRMNRRVGGGLGHGGPVSDALCRLVHYESVVVDAADPCNAGRQEQGDYKYSTYLYTIINFLYFNFFTRKRRKRELIFSAQKASTSHPSNRNG